MAEENGGILGIRHQGPHQNGSPSSKGALADLAPIEAALKQRFLPVLFREGNVTAELGYLTQLSIKASGMALPNPTSMDHQA